MLPVPKVITHVYDLILYLVPQVAKFPKNQRYLLGERIERHVFDILEGLIAAVYSKDKLVLLQKTNIQMQQLQFFVRLAKDLSLINAHRYEVLSKMLHEIGLQIGAWSKYMRRADAKPQ